MIMEGDWSKGSGVAIWAVGGNLAGLARRLDSESPFSGR